MIKPEELKILNYVMFQGEEKEHLSEVKRITEHNVDIEIIGEGESFLSLYQTDCVYRIKPILTTKDYLLKFGFLKEKKTDKYIIRIVPDTSYLMINIKTKECFIYGKCSLFTSIIYPNFVHQLQNLYYALTGKELK